MEALPPLPTIYILLLFFIFFIKSTLSDIKSGLISFSKNEIEYLISNMSGSYLYDYQHPYSAGVPDGFVSWEEWWRWSVASFVKTLHDSIQSVKPYVKLSAAVLGKYNWSGWRWE